MYEAAQIQIEDAHDVALAMAEKCVIETINPSCQRSIHFLLGITICFTRYKPVARGPTRSNTAKKLIAEAPTQQTLGNVMDKLVEHSRDLREENACLRCREQVPISESTSSVP